MGEESIKAFFEGIKKQKEQPVKMGPLLMTQRDYDLTKEHFPELLEGKEIHIIPVYEPRSMEIIYDLPKNEGRPSKKRTATKKKYRYKKRKK